MESVVVAFITGAFTLVGVIVANSRSRAVMHEKIEALTRQVEKHNRVLERTFALERDMAVVQNDIETLHRRTEEC